MQQASRNRAKRMNSDTTGGSATPTLQPVPMDESIEKMGESAECLKYNVRLVSRFIFSAYNSIFWLIVWLFSFRNCVAHFLILQQIIQEVLIYRKRDNERY